MTRFKSDTISNINKAPQTPLWAKKIGCAVANMAVGTSIFDPVVCEICYKWFCPPYGKILDPFAGGSVRGIVASFLGYEYIGIDIRRAQLEANQKQANDILVKVKKKPVWITGNSMDIKKLLKNNNSFDFLFSCPPYFDLEVYSEEIGDLSNLDWFSFVEQYRVIIKNCVSLLKDDRFAVFVISDIRDKKGIYRMLPELTIDCFTNNENVCLYNNIIILNNAGSLPFTSARIFSSSRKVSRIHQNVFVFYKGDPRNINKNFGEIEIDDSVLDM